MASPNGVRTQTYVRASRIGRSFAFTVLVGALCTVSTARAQQASGELLTQPFLKIETGLHIGTITAMSVDAENRFAVTASDDKTARVWSLPGGKLQSILRLPIG